MTIARSSLGAPRTDPGAPRIVPAPAAGRRACLSAAPTASNRHKFDQRPFQIVPFSSLSPALLCFLILVLCVPACLAADPAQLSVSVPQERQVFQRSSRDAGKIQIACTLPAGADGLEARLTLVDEKYGGKSVDWTAVKAQPAPSDTAHAELPAAPGGWYKLELRAKKGADVLAQAAVEKVGVGEVFVTAGQSNSANFGQKRQSAQDDRVVYFDGMAFVPARDPIPGGFGGGGTPWGLLGDLLAAKWKVPVAFRSSTLTYTPVAMWLPEAKHKQYPTLVERTKQLGPCGVRAVLWHQGESDSLAKTTAQQYRDRLTTVIRSMRKDIGYDVDWFVAQASFHPGSTREQEKPVAEGQKLLWASKVCRPGPVTDDMLGKENRYDGVHFSEAALKVHAQRWAEAIGKQYDGV